MSQERKKEVKKQMALIQAQKFDKWLKDKGAEVK